MRTRFCRTTSPADVNAVDKEPHTLEEINAKVIRVDIEEELRERAAEEPEGNGVQHAAN